jgi:hypothetical protein
MPGSAYYLGISVNAAARKDSQHVQESGTTPISSTIASLRAKILVCFSSSFGISLEFSDSSRHSFGDSLNPPPVWR